jgi:tetratricopeptide (TPR) repeat protein
MKWMERMTDFLHMKKSLLCNLLVVTVVYSAPAIPEEPPPRPPIDINAVFQEGRTLTSRAAEADKRNDPISSKLYEDAIAKYKDVVKEVEERLKDPKNPTDKDALGADAYFNLGAVYMIRKDYDKAVVELEKSNKLSPIADDRTLTNLGISYRKSQPFDKTQLDKATKILQQAIDLNPNNTLAQRELKEAQREFKKLKSKRG